MLDIVLVTNRWRVKFRPLPYPNPFFYLPKIIIRNKVRQSKLDGTASSKSKTRYALLRHTTGNANNKQHNHSQHYCSHHSYHHPNHLNHLKHQCI